MGFEDEGYELEELVARDAWGELYRARYVSHGRTVLFRAFDARMAEPGPWELAAAEIQAWARLDHPSVVQPLDWANTSSGAFLAMEMPRGELLRDCLRREGPAALADPDAALAGVAGAVEAARAMGVLHLGLGDTCVWVCPDSSVMVSDFGLWYVASEFPESFEPRGAFSAPEQALPRRAGASADVYSIALLYLAAVRGRDAASAAAAGGEVPADGEGFMAGRLRQCLDGDPRSRPGSAGELLAGFAGGAGQTAPAFRDCPVCRLKEEIAGDFRLKRPTVAARLRELDSDLFDVQACDGPVGPERAGWDPAARRQAVAARLFPWVALALGVLALVVWWLAFRQ